MGVWFFCWLLMAVFGFFILNLFEVISILLNDKLRILFLLEPASFLSLVRILTQNTQRDYFK